MTSSDGTRASTTTSGNHPDASERRSCCSSTGTTDYPQWHNFVAGGIAGLCSRMVTAPLDLIRIRRQLQASPSMTTTRTVTYPSESIFTSWHNIIQKEGGISALYRGNMSAIYLWITYSAVQFSIYNQTKDKLQTILPVLVDPNTKPQDLLNHTNANHDNDHNNNTTRMKMVVSFCSGAIAGLCATIVTYPFDVCRTTFSAYGLTTAVTTSSTSTTTGTTTAMNTKPPPPPTTTTTTTMTSIRHPTIVTADAGAALTQPWSTSVTPPIEHQAVTRPAMMMQRQQPPLPLSSLYEPPLFPPATIKPSMPSTNTIPSYLATQTAILPAIHPPIHPSHQPVSVSVPLQHQHQQRPLPRTLIQFVQQMYQIQGFRGFYAGVTPAIIQIIPYMGCNFAIYDYLTTTTSTRTTTHADDDPTSSHTATSSGDKSVSIGLSAYAGSISGALSKMMVYPLDTVKRRLQAQAFFTSSHVWQDGSHHHNSQDTTTASHTNTSHPSRHKHYNGMYDCILSIYRNEGMASFYRGIVPSVLKTAIATSLTFSCFRWTQSTLHWTHDNILHLRSM